MENYAELYLQTLSRLREAAKNGTCWETSLVIAREMGADALNAAMFKGRALEPVWIRISTHEKGGLARYVENDFMSVDPVLVARAQNKLKDIDHVSLKENIASGQLSTKELACHKHLLRYGQSDFVTFRIRKAESQDEMLVVFACNEEKATWMVARSEEISVVANLFAMFIAPPTPNEPTGKVPLLYEFITKRERQILQHVAQGHQNAEIAYRLGITDVTVRMHSASARRKMNATTRAQAVALALARGLITL
jgi:DNA-binding CsgD family transcriptional regulator